GHEVEPIWGITAQRFVDAAEGRMLADVERDMAERAKELAGGRPSLLQDVMRGRRTEVQYLNGYVSEQGRQVGVATPFNDKGVEYSFDAPGEAPTRLLLKSSRDGLGAGLQAIVGEREVAFYTQAAPLMPGGPFPRCYDAECSSGRFHLLLEDLSETHMVLTQW